MEFTQIKSRVLSVRLNPMNKDQATSQSFSGIDKSEISSEIYRLKGNSNIVHLKDYTERMQEYMKKISEQSLMHLIRKKRMHRGFYTPTNQTIDTGRRFRLNPTPSKLSDYYDKAVPVLPKLKPR